MWKALFIVTLITAAPAWAQGQRPAPLPPPPARPPAQPPVMAPLPPAPVLVEDKQVRLVQDMDLVDHAIRGYWGRWLWKYPEANSFPELLEILKADDLLPRGFLLNGEVTEFRMGRHDYRITATRDDRSITIQPPRRPPSIWDLLWM